MGEHTEKMTYERFKRYITENLAAYLRAPYCAWTLQINRVPKINGFVEALHLVAPSGTGASPNLYLQERYTQYVDGKSLQAVLQESADFFSNGMEMAERVIGNFMLKDTEPRIIFCLINREKNRELLRHTPHRTILDLAVIYRLLAASPQEAVYSAMITDGAAEELGMTEEQLYRQAVKSTRTEMPPLVEKLSQGFYMITNKMLVMGAVAIFYRGVLAELAEKEKSDLYIIPSSIHEVFAIPINAVESKELEKLIREINRRFVDDNAVLSDHLYWYDAKEMTLRFARPGSES